MDELKLEDVIKSLILEILPKISRRRLQVLVDKYYSAFVSAVIAMELE